MCKDYDYNKYRQRYNERHPEKQRQWRLNSAANMLRKAGYKVYSPSEQIVSLPEFLRELKRLAIEADRKEVSSR